MNRALILFGLILCSPLVIAQAKPGFYMTMDIDMELCHNKMKLINTEVVFCLSEEPVIDLGMIEKVDEMIFDSVYQARKFQIVLTLKGADFISTLARKLPDNQLGLVTNGILVSTIGLDGITKASSIIIWDYNDSQALDWVHRSLVKAVSAYHKKS